MAPIANLLANDLMSRIIVALIAAGAGYLSAVLVDRSKAKREPRRELSWEIDQNEGLFSVRTDIREKVEVLYNHNKVQSLTVLQCRISNTGNSVVKSERVRFSFPSDTKMLESFLDPKPERELRVLELADAKEQDNEIIYSIGQLERDQRVNFQFVLEGKVLPEWAPYASNEQGDVAFQKRALSRARQDQEHLRPFFTILILALLALPLASIIPFYDGVVTAAVYLVLIAFLTPHIGPTARVLAEVVTSLSADRLFHVELKGSQGVQIGDYSSQVNRYERRADSGENDRQ